MLAGVDRDLTRAIHFGMFSWLVVPLLRALKWINVYIGNYGWSIIALTVLINLVMFPLRHKSVVSMRKMQEIQPQVKAIQDRYAHLKMTDPARQKMNQEMMQLYKDRGVNPASGCVPMLLTLPVLFAFYAMLSVAIELRGAPFIGFAGLSRPPFEAAFTPCVEIGWRLAFEHWGHGYATEAAKSLLAFGFDELQLPEIVSFTTVSNIRSRAVMDRIGLTYDPTGDFDHPSLDASHPLRPHVLYRLKRPA